MNYYELSLVTMNYYELLRIEIKNNPSQDTHYSK